MKHIIKNQEPEEFTQWKSGKTTTKWERLSNAPKVKDALYKSLIKEQGGICCYCEKKLLNKNFHIEHFMPRSLDENLTFDYTNLLCSCQANIKKGTPLICGNAKRNTFHQNIISPLEEDCEDYFIFTYDGIIKGKNRRGKETIEILNLNEPELVESRKALIDTFTDMLPDSDYTDEDFLRYIQDHLSKNNGGQFIEFWTTINYLFGDLPTE